MSDKFAHENGQKFSSGAFCRIKIYIENNRRTTTYIYLLRVLKMYKIYHFEVGMDLLRNYNFWAFQTDFIEPEL